MIVDILMINETLDAATPYSGALQTRKTFPSSVLIEGRRRNHPRQLAVRRNLRTSNARQSPPPNQKPWQQNPPQQAP